MLAFLGGITDLVAYYERSESSCWCGIDSCESVAQLYAIRWRTLCDFAFTVSENKLRDLLSSSEVIKAPITSTTTCLSNQTCYVRVIQLDFNIGVDKFNEFKPTSTLSVMTDKYGNLVTATPGVLK